MEKLYCVRESLLGKSLKIAETTYFVTDVEGRRITMISNSTVRKERKIIFDDFLKLYVEQLIEMEKKELLLSIYKAHKLYKQTMTDLTKKQRLVKKCIHARKRRKKPLDDKLEEEREISGQMKRHKEMGKKYL